ncbi:hypothetical protein OJJOAM_000452 [Cupriavidus sp. H18C1]
MQRRGLRIGTRIARDHVQLVDRHIQLAALVVVQMQEFLVALAHVERDQALVAADAMLAVHDRVADLQLGQVAHHRVDAAGLLLLAAAGAARGIRIELGLGDEGQARLAVHRRQREAALQRRHRDRERRVAGEEGRAILDRMRTQAAVGEQLQQRLAAARRIGAHQHASLLAQQQRLEIDQRVLGAAIDRDVGQRGRQRSGVGAGRAFLQHQPRQRLGGAEELLLVQEQLRGRQQRPLAIVPHEVVALLRIGPEAADRLVDRADIGQLRAGRQVVEQRRRRVEEQRQVILDAGRRHAVADVLVDWRLARVALEHLAPAAAERGARGLVEREFAAGQQAHLLDRIEAALRVRIEGADGLDLVAEQVDPVRQRRAHREQVDQAAAHAVFAGPHHRADVLVAGQRELRLQRGLVEPFALLEEEGVGGEEGRRREPVQRGLRGHQHHVALAGLDVVQRRQALRHQVLVRREAVVGQGLPVGQHAHAQLRREPRDLVGQPLRVDRVGAHHRQHRHLAVVGAGIGGQRQRIGRAVQAGDLMALAGLDQRQLSGNGERGRRFGVGHKAVRFKRRHPAGSAGGGVEKRVVL